MLEGLAHLVDYPFSESDWIALSEGVRESNEQENRWYEYFFDCETRLDLLLAREVGTSMCTLKVSVNADLAQGLNLLVWLGQGNYSGKI